MTTSWINVPAIGIVLIVAILVASIVVPICDLSRNSNAMSDEGSSGLSDDGRAYRIFSVVYTITIASAIILVLTSCLLAMPDGSKNRP